jgi:hypothetical protein
MEQKETSMRSSVEGVQQGTQHHTCGPIPASNACSYPPVVTEDRFLRHDGWTPERIRTFLQTLSQCGVVSHAARAAGMSKRSAYKLRNSARGHDFDRAWRDAVERARRCAPEGPKSRVVDGRVEVIVRDGKVWGERHFHDNRLAMAVLTRLDEFAGSVSQPDDASCFTAQDFDALVDAACAGAEVADEFLRAPRQADEWQA